ncbi:MAG: CoA transferase [Acidobacteriota bacterium]|nr:CoA transferase [Acidobacteriota bacterium]
MSDTPLLEGIKVVEVATFVLAPAAGTIMGDFGAEVIHVEGPGIGDPYRYLHTVAPFPVSDQPYCWILTGRNKKSVALNLKDAEGRAILYRLVADADVFITNFHPSVVSDLGLGWEELAGHNERLVYAHATGYGDAGEEIEKPGYDATAWWARSGMMDTVRPPGADHAIATAGMGDNPSAVALFGAIMMGLYRRERTGKGSKVKTSLMANGVWANSIFIQAALCGAPAFEPPAHSESPNALISAYVCGDGEALYLAMINDPVEWPRLVAAIGRKDLVDDPRFADAESRRANSVALVAVLDETFASAPLSRWRQALDDHEVTFGIVNRIADVATDEQMCANGLLPEIEGSDGLRTVASPIEVEGVAKLPPLQAPVLGQHTGEVLASLGFDEAAVRDLAERRVVQLAASTT